ncbi:NlpC/P60 family protein [Actinacidiphila glaucinigra]|uniref:C40 family peptidase n=1 Tax=Actinacidiphila glaucinigra TaxID=235986 RepID=UPI0036CB5BE3
MKALTGLVAVVAAAVVLALGVLAIVVPSQDANAMDARGGLKGVPAEFRPWILQAASECQHAELSPALLAAQLQQESGFSTSHDTVSDQGAQGPAQFIPATWATWGVDADEDGSTDPFDIPDAVTAQGRYMCSLIGQAKSSGLSGDVRGLALAGYNAGWGAVERFRGVPPVSFADGQTYTYVRRILALMDQFQGADQLAVSGSGTGAQALRKAATRIGTPYAYGGGSPAGPSIGFCDGRNGYSGGTCVADDTVGFDCSSLVQYAYWPDVKLPRTAAAQYGATSDHPVSRAALQPGDLMFWADRGVIYHVAMYAGHGQILQAPRTGRDVEVTAISSGMPAADYYGATRP